MATIVPDQLQHLSRRQKRRADSLAAWLIILLFCAGLAAPMLGTFFPIGQSWRIAENRRLANLPKIRSLDLSEFVAAIDGWRRFARDRFGFRGDLIWLRSLILVRGLSVSSNSAVVLGEGDWMFYTHDRAIENYVRELPYSEEELQRTIEVLRGRAILIEKNWGARFAFVVVPAKETIYPAQLPRYLRDRRERNPKPTRLDQLSQRLANDPSFLFLDLRTTLLQRAEQERLYHKTDTHWNQRGAYLAYEAIVRAANDRGYALGEPVPRARFKIGQSISPGGDLAGMLGLQNEFREIQLDLVPRIQAQWVDQQWQFERNTPEGHRLVMFGDSFLPPLAPLLAENFSRATFIRSSSLLSRILDSQAPTLVIQQTSERLLSYPLN